MTKLPKCPICKQAVDICDSIAHGRPHSKTDRYFTRCGCVTAQISGKNTPDLEASWKRWVKIVKRAGPIPVKNDLEGLK